MSRRRFSLRQLVAVDEFEQQCQPQDSDGRETSTAFARLRGRASGWLSAQLGRMLVADDKAHEPYTVWSSLVSFVFGLLLVKIYGDAFDSAIGSYYERLRSGFGTFCGLVARVNAKDIETVAALCVLLLLWIGALRILANVVRQLVQLVRLR